MREIYKKYNVIDNKDDKREELIKQQRYSLFQTIGKEIRTENEVKAIFTAKTT